MEGRLKFKLERCRRARVMRRYEASLDQSVFKCFKNTRAIANPAVIEIGCTPGQDGNVYFVRDNGLA